MKCYIQLFTQLICCYIMCTGFYSDFTKVKDKPYEPIEFVVPKAVWRNAFNPTPVLKSRLRSPVTIVVPVHVPNDDELELDEVEETTTQSALIVEEPVVANNTALTIANTTVVDEQPVVANNTVETVTNATVADEAVNTTTAAPDQVVGQLFRFPCACRNGECGCCTGAILQRFNMKACGNISFIPEDFVFDVRLSVNNNTVVRRRVSASDPPPICFNPGRAPFVEVCAEISNIRIRNRNAYACLDIDANIGGFPIYTASFRCFGLGTKGIQTGLKPKPVKTPGPKPVSLFGGSSSTSSSDDGGGVLGTVASAVLGTGDGIFGGGNSDDDGPLDAIGDVVEDLFDGRSNYKK